MYAFVNTLLLLVGLACAIEQPQRAAVLGRSRCTWGPGYWCQHMGTMKKCNSATYCIRSWQRVRVQLGEANSECRFCQLLASDLKKMQEANATLPAIRSRATAACGLVQRSVEERELCKQIVNKYLNETLQLLRELPPAKVCAALGLCRSSRRVPRLGFESAPTPAVARQPAALLLGGAPLAPENSCVHCERVMLKVKADVEANKTREEIEDTLADICSAMGPMASRCEAAVQRFTPQILAFIDNGINPKQLCTLLGFCRTAAGSRSRSSEHILSVLMRFKNPPVRKLQIGRECQMCEMLVARARQLISNNKTDEEILDFVKQHVCSLAPLEKDKCVQAVTEYGHVVLSLLASELQPAEVCKALGACRNSLLEATPQCLACELVLRELDRLIGSNRTESAIQAALLDVCKVLPSTVSAECNQFVQQYSKVVIELLVHDLAPSLVCRVIGLCSSKSKVSAAPRSVGQDPCDFCLTAMAYLKTLLLEDRIAYGINKKLRIICNYLAQQYKDTCLDITEKVSKDIMKIISEEIHPEHLCEELKACDKPELRHNVQSQPGMDTVRMSQLLPAL